MKKSLTILWILSKFFLFSACVENEQETSSNNLSYIPNEFAKGFEINYSDNFKVLKVNKPWQNADNESFEYYLIPKTEEIPDSIKDKIIIRTPIESVVCLSTTHLGFIEKLNEHNSIIGLSGTYFVYDSIINSKIENKEIDEVGFEDNLNIEKIISLKPDVVFAYDITGSLSSKFEQLAQFGITVVYVGEYLETSPLGKAEWIKFFAEFFDKTEIAYQIFNETKTEYNEYIELIKEASSCPGVLVNIPFQGIWYLPGGESFMAKIIEDAGGNYLWKGKKQVESFSVSMEEIFSKNTEISSLINPGMSKSIDEILKTDSRLNNLNCIKNKRVYNNTKRVSKSGGNDFWESGTVNPHLILKDLAAIFHPEIFQQHEFYYYEKIE